MVKGCLVTFKTATIPRFRNKNSELSVSITVTTTGDIAKTVKKIVFIKNRKL